MTEERLDDLRRTPRQADVTDVEDLVSEIDRLHTEFQRIIDLSDLEMMDGDGAREIAQRAIARKTDT